MARFVWAIICKQAILNAETDNFSLIEIFQEIEIPFIDKDRTDEFFYPLDFDLVVSWAKDDEQNDLDSFSLMMISPSGEEKLRGSHPLKFEKNSNRSITVFHFNGLPISSLGDYGFQIGIPLEKQGELQIIGSISLVINSFQ